MEQFHPDLEKYGRIEMSLQNWASGRVFCSTQHSRLGFVPKNTKVGDVVCILYGSEVPYILRPRDDGSYAVIGECYVHGIMHGEVLSEAVHETKDFELR